MICTNLTFHCLVKKVRTVDRRNDVQMVETRRPLGFVLQLDLFSVATCEWDFWYYCSMGFEEFQPKSKSVCG